jgi:acetyl esterase/lipase
MRLLLAALFVASTWLAASAAEPIKVPLWDGKAPNGDGTVDKADATIYVHKAENPNGTAVIICPGGGYGGQVMDHEGHFIAQWLNKHGVTGVVLQYRLPRGRARVPLLDAQRAIRTVRAHAKEWGVDPGKVGICGFSAGGHLASTAGTHFDAGDAKSEDQVSKLSSRPDFMILVYPVITMGPKGHGGSRTNLLGPKPTDEQLKLFSNEQQVTKKTPPAFLAHAKDDGPVPPENSELFHQALLDNGIRTSKLLILPSGGHGLNGYKGPMWDQWQKESLEWLRGLNFIREEDVK